MSKRQTNRKQRRMTSKVELITPKIAEQMLKNNNHNRNLSQVLVDQYANAMARDAWKDNGATIVMSGNKLIDGQHRLRAVIQSGISREFVVVRGIRDEAFATVDTGSRRGLKDVLSIDDEKNAPTLATAINVHSAYTQGGQFRPRLRRHNATYGEQRAYLEEYPSLRKSVAFVTSFAEKTLVPRGPLAALHALFAEKNQILANDFIRKFVTGSEITRRVIDQPVKAVRDKLIADATQRAGSLTQVERCVVVSLGWNATRTGAALRRIQVSARGQNKARTVEIE